MFDRIEAGDHEQVVFCQDRSTGLRAVIAVHSTVLGPALGGTRFYPYASEEAAVTDVLRLSEGMTYKSAVAGLDLGGGKAVILGDPATDKGEGLMRAYARFVDALGGRYVTAEDVGTTQADMDLIRRETTHVTGVSRALGGSGDPSAATAYGVFWAMRAVLFLSSGTSSVAGQHVVVSGVGKVGTNLVRHLVEERAHVTVADVDPAAVDRVRHDFDVATVPAAEAHQVQCDIFSPCALGAVLDRSTIPALRCWAVVGAANNQLADPGCADLLAEAGLLYAPDFVVNAGGVINIAEELGPKGYHRERAYAAVRRIYDTTLAVFDAAKQEGVPTAEAAQRIARRRMDTVAHVHQLRTFT